jgi:hypothetical protein
MLTMTLAGGHDHVVTPGDLERFWVKVDKSGPVPPARPDLGPCWLWTAKINQYGYGDFGLRSRLVKAHRLSYTILVGSIPDGLTLDHLCRVRNCVNPRHLEAVTQRVNTLRGDGFAADHAAKTKCPNDHPYDEANTYVSNVNGRHCRTCHRDRERARKREIRKRGE